jgi:hypothetical protein
MRRMALLGDRIVARAIDVFQQCRRFDLVP